MHRIGVTITCLLLGSLTAGLANAGPRFIDTNAFATDGNLRAADAISTSQPIHGGLFVTFKEVGLGSNAGTLYRVTADASATYGCVNGGSNHPKATNKQTVAGPVAASATFSSDQNGQVSGSIAVAPLSPGTLSCPQGQTQELVSVSYTNVVVTDLTNGISSSIPGTFSLTFFK